MHHPRSTPYPPPTLFPCSPPHRLPKINEPFNTVSFAAALPSDATGLGAPLAPLEGQMGPLYVFDDVLSQQQVAACAELGSGLHAAFRCVLWGVGGVLCEGGVCASIHLVHHPHYTSHDIPMTHYPHPHTICLFNGHPYPKPISMKPCQKIMYQ